MKIQESAENYLETILVLGNRHGAVRSIDIATEMGFSKPSVSIAMKNLRTNGYIEVDDRGHIVLTNKGNEIAKKIYAKHTLLIDLFTHIGVSPEVAEQDACKIEHDLSEETFEKLKEFLGKVKL
ncbi:MAG: DtxR family transcriptional regulator [Epulopiscium sp. Nele67-Bin004]|nr:MAG: DtxR family transcriptional regulator [Epulopiscium sp. Nele67-Bin004]